MTEQTSAAQRRLRHLRRLLSHGRSPETSEEGWEASRRLQRPLQASSPDEVRDILTAMCLAEAIYKRPESEVSLRLGEWKAQFPPGTVVCRSYQLSLGTVPHRYLLAEGPGALYASFIGTKQPRDLLADSNFIQAPLWEAQEEARELGIPLPRCHAGFLSRARAIPVVHLYLEARRRGRRLVLCGHSLGGAVAQVSALRLLLALSAQPSADGNAPAGRTAADDALPLLRPRMSSPA
jgi:Lipase (class 3)